MILRDLLYVHSVRGEASDFDSSYSFVREDGKLALARVPDFDTFEELASDLEAKGIYPVVGLSLNSSLDQATLDFYGVEYVLTRSGWEKSAHEWRHRAA